MGEVVSHSRVRIQRVRGSMRWTYLPGEWEPGLFGVPLGAAERYRVAPSQHEPHATTLDHAVAATAG